MKNLRTTAKTFLLVGVLSLMSQVELLADTTKLTELQKIEANYLAEISSGTELDRLERELIAEGVIQCENVTIVKILDENDQLIYEGEMTGFDSQDEKLRSLMAKADFLINVDDTTFYKIF